MEQILKGIAIFSIGLMISCSTNQDEPDVSEEKQIVESNILDLGDDAFENMKFGDEIVRGTYNSPEELTNAIRIETDKAAVILEQERNKDKEIPILVNIVSDSDYVMHIGGAVPPTALAGKCPKDFLVEKNGLNKSIFPESLEEIGDRLGKGDDILIRYSGKDKRISICFRNG